MQISFVGQPFKEFGWLADQLNTPLFEANDGELRIAVAWAKRSGLSQLQDSLATFREQGGTVSAIIGIDEGGATKQGLELSMDIFDDVRIFHDYSSRTYHPKVYLLRSGNSARLVVGSNNATAGGLCNNYEATLICDLDLSLEDDQQLYAQVSGWFDVLLSDAVCRPLNSDLIADLVNNPRYLIGNEDNPSKDIPQEHGDHDSVTSNSQETDIFGTSSTPKKGLATRSREGVTKYRRRPVDEIPEPTSNSVSSESPAEIGAVRWYKSLSASDAQRPPNGNPTGNLKLTSARQSIDRDTFFRYMMFGSENWTIEQKARGNMEQAVVPIEVFVEGANLGRMNFKIDHAHYRIADQNNVPTWLHWGPLQTTLATENYAGYWVILEYLSDGSHQLQITSENPEQAS